MSTTIKWYDDNKNRKSTTVATPSDIPSVPSVPTVNKSDLRNFVGFFNDMKVVLSFAGSTLNGIADIESNTTISTSLRTLAMQLLQSSQRMPNYETYFEDAFGL